MSTNRRLNHQRERNLTPQTQNQKQTHNFRSAIGQPIFTFSQHFLSCEDEVESFQEYRSVVASRATIERSEDLAPPEEPAAVLRFRQGATFAAAAAARERESVNKEARRKVVTPETGGEGLGLLFLTLAMAVGGIVLVAVLVVVHFTASPPPPVEAASPGKEVTYGSVIKLQHERTKYRLHSHEVPYGSGSGQQSVTAFPGVEDGNSHWIVRPTSDDEHEHEHEQGDVIPNGSLVRLQHVRTRKWLHSHLHQSPISGNLEVSAFGGEEQSDTGDYWRLEIEGKGTVWMQDQKVRLRHVDTNGYLHSHDKKYSRIVQGQQEVCGVTKKNADNLWTAAEGIYFLPKGNKVV